jgi:hypothetical protein
VYICHLAEALLALWASALLVLSVLVLSVYCLLEALSLPEV